MLKPVAFVEDSAQAKSTSLGPTAVAIRLVGAAGMDVTVTEAVPIIPAVA